MKNLNRLLLLAFAAAFLLSGALLLQCQRTKKEAFGKARAVRLADSLQADHAYYAGLAEADSTIQRGQRAATTAQADEIRLRSRSAATWSDDSLQRFLSEHPNLPAPRRRHPQR